MLSCRSWFTKCCTLDKDQMKQDYDHTIHILDKPRNKPEEKVKSGYGGNNTNTYLFSEACDTTLGIPKYRLSSFASENDTKSNYNLHLKILESAVLPIGTIFPICPNTISNTSGANRSDKRYDDDMVFIGSQDLLSRSVETQMNFSSDIHIGGDSAIGSRHCVIKYFREKKSYCIRDLGTGSGTFVKITSKLPLKSGMIINFADTYMIVTFQGWPKVCHPIGGESKSCLSQITIKILDGPRKDEIFTFSNDTNLIKIGRMQDCQINFKDSQLSRYQCNIEKIDSGWYIEDGYDHKQSTNGTWIFPTDYTDISNGSILRIGKNIFSVSSEKSSQLGTINRHIYIHTACYCIPSFLINDGRVKKFYFCIFFRVIFSFKSNNKNSHLLLVLFVISQEILYLIISF